MRYLSKVTYPLHSRQSILEPNVKRFYFLFILMLSIASSLYAQDTEDAELDKLYTYSLEELLSITVVTASGTEEKIRDAPAKMIVITAQDIQRRGYQSLDEVIIDLPGFDTMVVNGPETINTYQRGYRQPYSNRTLMMIDGIVDNELYTQEAYFAPHLPLSNVERIEVLYGPSSAVYGPNAFLGIVNVITKDPKNIIDSFFTANLYAGSFDTQALDMGGGGRLGDLSFSISARLHQSSPDLDDYNERWGFLSEEQISDRTTWGPLLDVDNEAGSLGSYGNESNREGVLAKANYQQFDLGLIYWSFDATYGPYYAADKAQSNVFWKGESKQLYLEHNNDVTEDISVYSLLLHRSSKVGGNWAEAEPDWNDPLSLDSYISYSDWNTQNSSWLFKQNYEFSVDKSLAIHSGIKYERKELTKNYDVCGYWSDAFCSNLLITDPDDPNYLGPYGLGQGVAHSTDLLYVVQPETASSMPSSNLIDTTDKGVFLLGIYDFQPFRLNAGIRYDHNSLYGSSTNPRISLIHHTSKKLTQKIIYGEAFQEPPPVLVFGGWTGRNANPDLKPETAKNLEYIIMYNSSGWGQELSVYDARYSDVIKEEAENEGKRKIQGIEYGLHNEFSTLIPITTHFYYTYTKAQSNIYYDQDSGEWLQGSRELGDIAKHKASAGIYLSLMYDFGLYFNVNYVGKRKLYLRNPLRGQGEEIGDYYTMDMTVNYTIEDLRITFKVKNLTDEAYYHPGAGRADSGNDFSQRSVGYNNSLVTQLGRSFSLNFSYSL